MAQDIRKVNDMESLMTYFSEKLGWDIDPDDFYDIDDITYDFDAEDLGLKEEAFAKITSLKQLRPLVDDQKWGIFFVDFDSKKFEVSALRKILSGLIPTRRNASEHAVWNQADLLFLCTWGQNNKVTIGAAHFEDSEKGLPQIKMISCEPAVEDFTQVSKFEQRLAKLQWPADTSDTDSWRETWASAFTVRYRQAIQDSHTLTVRLAEEAQNIRDRILDILDIETKNGYVHLLFEKFQNTLVHDMTETQFAVMYAQTIVYGLFSARCMDTTQDDFSAAEAVDCIPNTNPFLKSLMQECLGSYHSKSKLSFDELEIGNIVELLMNTRTDAIIADFNRQTGGGREDPVIHFYEEFLTEYDKTQKVQRGVYYTPQPVVNFIVRAVDDILKSEFGIADGLASTETKTIKVTRESLRKVGGFRKNIEVDKEVPAVQILDPATGTGTFLRQTILQIYQDFCDARKGKSKKQIQKEWNQYVPEHLLPRLNGFELMMAPYAVAHMKLAMVLKDTGYEFDGDKRLQVYLTNSLEEPGNSDGQMTLFDDPLAFESIAANGVKKNTGINVLLGNPPYSGESANKGPWIMELMEDYKKEPGGLLKLQERNPKWLNDDYVKFIRFCEEFILTEKNGIIAFINPHGFIDNPTFRGMRWRLLRSFDKIYIIDLHGNSNRKEKCPDGSKDENVFDIQQGVSINIFIRTSASRSSLAEVFHTDIWGIRDYKYATLLDRHLSDISFDKVQLAEPDYSFKPLDLDVRNQYINGFAVDELFDKYSVGIVTAKDKILIDENKEELLKKVSEYYQIVADKKKVYPIYYRPLDQQYIYYDPKLLERSRENVMSAFYFDNIGLITARSNKGEDCSQFLVSDMMSEAKCGERTTQSALFPLYTYYKNMNKVERSMNLNKDILLKIEKTIGAYIEDTDRKGSYTPRHLLAYMYAFLYSNQYRSKYKEFINSSFPRIPYPKSRAHFDKCVALGNQLIELHLINGDIESFESDNELVGHTIEKVSFKNGKVFINKTIGFEGVDEKAWNFIMCGYQPMQKWMKDRKGKMLTKNNVSHFRKMNNIIVETINVMEEIDRSSIL